jgi:hypothetical protein
MVLAPAAVEVRLHVPAAAVPVQVWFPSLTVTLPVGVPLPGEFAVTVKATAYGWPTTVAVERSVVIAVVVLALFTVCAKLGEVLPLKLPSPL